MEDLIPILTAAIPVLAPAILNVVRELARSRKPPPVAAPTTVNVYVVNSPGAVVKLDGHH